ncbi:NAD(P)H-dependent oxidoreductase [Nonomuraea sp. KC401]|uniref:NADPH-dependent FMN reductase n=1 Tax=unclassified Nonomuraea TaxID=2593643 RepID=UPI0010FD28CB|nr:MULTISPECIES: NAD(P)H-dependent oxidoreductase [unclassified Nonomuraea]NBE99784.1 NADPH-dependent FMN reductase [Nonomuraea sp. K271]TLF55658.1 NAD(P)H-dependent oxidoreductase [Nonomuraea sp. KC401]
MRSTIQPPTADQAELTSRPKVAIIVGSTRPGRKAEAVAAWVHDLAARRDDATFEVVDIADYTLPHLDEPVPPRAGHYSHPHTHAWAQKIGAYDAYVFVTPEYNASVPGALKNAIDFLYAEWNGKAAGFVGYGIQGGTRAVEHLRQILGDLEVVDMPTTVALTLADDFQDHTYFTPSAVPTKNVALMLDELVARTAQSKGAGRSCPG